MLPESPSFIVRALQPPEPSGHSPNAFCLPAGFRFNFRKIQLQRSCTLRNRTCMIHRLTMEGWKWASGIRGKRRDRLCALARPTPTSSSCRTARTIASSVVKVRHRYLRRLGIQRLDSLPASRFVYYTLIFKSENVVYASTWASRLN